MTCRFLVSELNCRQDYFRQSMRRLGCDWNYSNIAVGLRWQLLMRSIANLCRVRLGQSCVELRFSESDQKARKQCPRSGFRESS